MPKQDVAVELYYDGDWRDIAADDDVLAEQPIVIRRGQGEESTALRPSSISLRLANDDDLYRTSNPESPLYGKTGRNTPIRVKVGGAVRGIAEVASWSCGQTRDFRASPRRGKAWCDVEAFGILQRVGAWTRAIQPPMTRWLAADANSVGMWPLEDGGAGIAVGYASLAQVIPDRGKVGRASVDYVTFHGDDGPAGGSPCIVLKADSSNDWVGGTFHRHPHSGWQALFHFKMDEVPPDGTYRTLFYNRLTNANRVSWKVNDTNFLIEILSPSGSVLMNTAAAHTGTVLTNWVRCRLKVTVSGGTVTVEPAWCGQDGTTFGFTDTYAATSTGALMSWFLYNTFDFDVAYSTVFGTTDTSLALDTGDSVRSFNGFRNERSSSRWFRLLNTESGLPYEYVGDFLTVSRMGPQRSDSLPELLQEVATTEDGLIYDSIDVLRPVLLLRNARYNQSPALTLTPADLPFLPDEVTDDLDVANVVTAQQAEGSSFTARDDTSLLGTQDPPDGVGEYRRTVGVNVANEGDDLPQVANWWLRRSTVNLPRYPQVTVDLNANPGLVSDVEAVEIGNVIEITGFREDTVRLIVLGWTETIGTHSRAIVFNCVPDQQFQVGEYDSARYDSASTMLVGGADASLTTLKFGTTDPGDVWSTTAEPYDVMIAGERITVTSMGAPSGNAELLSSAFEQTADITAWGVNADCTLARSGTFAHGGSFSGLMTTTGTPVQSYIRPTLAFCPRVVPGQSYTHSVWVRSVAGLTDVRATIDWLDEDGGYLSSSDSGAGGLASGSWVQRQVTATAPAGAAYAQYGPTILSNPSTGTLLYVDDATISAAVVSYQTATVTRSVNGVAKSLAAGEPVHVATPGRWAL